MQRTGLKKHTNIRKELFVADPETNTIKLWTGSARTTGTEETQYF
jgi:hypothetical protein